MCEGVGVAWEVWVVVWVVVVGGEKGEMRIVASVWCGKLFWCCVVSTGVKCRLSVCVCVKVERERERGRECSRLWQQQCGKEREGRVWRGET